MSRIKSVLFPNNGYPAPSPPDPPADEQLQIRETLERRLVELGSGIAVFYHSSHKLTWMKQGIIPSLIFGHNTSVRESTAFNLVEPLSNQSANTHLILFVFDAVILALFPEIGLLSNGDSASLEGT